MGWIPNSFSPIPKVSQRQVKYNFAQDINVQGVNLHREGWQQALCLGNCQAGGATGPLNRTLMPPLPPVGAIPKGPGGPCGTPDAPLTPAFITSADPFSNCAAGQIGKTPQPFTTHANRRAQHGQRLNPQRSGNLAHGARQQ